MVFMLHCVLSIIRCPAPPNQYQISKVIFRDVGDWNSIITGVEHGPSIKWASIITRRGKIDYGEHERHVFVKSMFWKMAFTEILHNSLKNIWIDQTGFNTNPKGGNRQWRTREAWFREIDVLKIQNPSFEGAEYSKTEFLINTINFFTWQIGE